MRIRIRIRPKIEQIIIFFCIRFKTHNNVFVVILSLLFAYIKQNKKIYFYNFGLFVREFITIFFRYLDPDQRFLKWIRIPPNDTDPTGSGSETLQVSKPRLKYQAAYLSKLLISKPQIVT